MADVLIVTDAPHVADEIRAVLDPGDRVRVLADGSAVIATVTDDAPDLAVLDMQAGNMGGIASCMELRLESGSGRIPRIPVLLLLDRRADVFLARRADAEGWVLKPLDPIRLRRAARALLDGGRFEDQTYLPTPVVVGGDDA